MRFVRSVAVCLCGVLLATGAAGESWAQGAEIPPALRDWIGWVVRDHEYRTCPLLVSLAADEEGSYACAWPGELAIDADAGGARFSQRWNVYARSAVPLPGDADEWPQAVRLDGAAAAVTADEEGLPIVWLEAGNHTLDGRLEWSRRPESLRVDERVALVRLTVDGGAVFPLQREGAALWFGRAETEAKESDSLQLEVFRKLADGVPATLMTQVALTVSGEGREETLGKPLPDGWRPIALSSELPARIDGDGTLIVQVRPGSYTLRLTARAPEPLQAVVRPANAVPWPEQEIWSYEAMPRLRVTQAIAANPIDPAQAGVPSDWAQLPAFVLDAEETLKVEERSRGLSDQDRNRLGLTREMWLDFDGDGWSTKDRIGGQMVREWRLDVAAPFVLTRAEEGGEGLLVTQGARPGLTGVEVRQRSVDVAASTRIDGGAGSLPVTGWQQSFDGVSTVVHLPPGYKLYAAPGADLAPAAWISRWNLLDIFLVAISTVLAAWLGGRAFGALVLAYLVLAYQESMAPLFAVLVVIGAALLVKLVPLEGKLATALRWTRTGLLLILVLFALPFVADQVRMALYPQLERWSAEAGEAYPSQTAPILGAVQQEAVQFEARQEPPMPMAPPPPPRAAEEVDKAGSFAQDVFASRKAARRLQRYASNTVVQAGYGEPGWTWSRYELSWSGPVQADQTVRLVVSPPWLTRLTRVAVVLLLALVILRLARDARRGGHPPTRAARHAPTPILAAAALCLPGVLAAQTLPTPELLEELRERVLAAPDCAPTCGHIAAAAVLAEGERVRVALDVAAAERVAVPLPADEGLLAFESLRVDGVSEGGVLRRAGGEWWVVLPRGVHRVELALRAANVDKIGLRFPLRPARITFGGREWEANGIRDERLLTDTLDLVRVRASTEPSAAAATGVAQQFAPFVRVVRRITFGIDWEVVTEVQRIAPDQAAFSVRVPLLPGERVLSSDLKVQDGQVTVPVQAGEGGASWSSQLERVDSLALAAPPLIDRAEVWLIEASPLWNLRHSGVAAVYPEGADWVHEFHPVPGETLALGIARPATAAGTTLAIDGVTLASQVGKRASEHALDLTLRSTQGGQHVIALPPDADVMSVAIGGETVNVRPEDGKLGLPIKPGSQQASIRWRENRAIGVVSRTPPVGLGAQASNVGLTLNLPADRWVLAARGPRVGPAVLYWGELVVMALVAFALSRFRRTPLKLHHWLLLGLGFSTFSWGALLVVVAWLFALDWRGRAAPIRDDTWFNLAQIGLVFLTVIALTFIVVGTAQGLLSTPDMHLVGNGSTPTALRWFADRSEGPLPTAAVFTLSLWWYKAAILAWALWLSMALVGWLKWGWSAYSAHGYWRNPPPRKPSPPPAASA
jgi:hypothetical protein